MSVYSGFTTRQQEGFYNKVLERIIQLMAVKLMQTIKALDEATASKLGSSPQKGLGDSPAVLAVVGSESERKWFGHLRKLYKAMYSMDKQKYLEPKFSTSLYPLMKFLVKRFGVSGAMTEFSAANNAGKLCFNDTFSLSSLISNEGNLSNQRRGDPLPSSSRLTMLLDDARAPSSFGNVLEQHTEDEDEHSSGRKSATKGPTSVFSIKDISPMAI